MIETVLLWLFAATALGAAALMLVLRHPMRVALALIATMLSLAGVYALLGVHVIAIFQVLIYVGAVMVFMVYAIMLLDIRDRSFTRRFSRLLVPGFVAAVLFLAILAHALWRALPEAVSVAGGDALFGLRQFSVEFVEDYWLHFELVSVLLVAAVVAALAVLKWGDAAVDDLSMLIATSAALFALGLLGVIVRRNVLVMLMCMELMLNGVNLSLVTFAQQTASTAGAVLVFLVFVVATAEIAIAIPIVLLLARRKQGLDLGAYSDLKG